MSTKLGVIVADFRTSLAVKMAVGATTGTLQSATDDDAVALPAGNYYMTIDGDNSQKEHIRCTLAGTALSSVKSVSRQGVQTAGTVREHRIGASVTITNFAHLKEINDLVSGATDLDASDPLKYDGVASITDNAHLATKKYVDDTAFSGAPDATTVVKGIIELATTAEAAAGTAAGGTGANLVPANSMFNATSSAAVLVPVTNGSGKISDGFLNKGTVSGIASLNASTKVVEDPANATATPTASKIPIADGSGDLARGWINFDLQSFTVNGTWTKPADIQYVEVVCIGAGGGGGGGSKEAAGSGGNSGGGGGGGGAVTKMLFRASDLGATETITVGVGGTSGAGGGAGVGSPGGDGGLSSFGTWLRAGGGGGGLGGFVSASVAGGGGGSVVSSAVANVGGAPTVSAASISGQGITEGATANGFCSEFGGAGGGAAGYQSNGFTGGSSIFAGPAGGGGGGLDNGATEYTGGAGGAGQSYTAGGGGAAGAAATAGTAGSTNAVAKTGYCGSAGGGGGSGNAVVGGAGGNGGAPGAGAGGGGATHSGANGGAGGVGGRGEVIIKSW